MPGAPCKSIALQRITQKQKDGCYGGNAVRSG